MTLYSIIKFIVYFFISDLVIITIHHVDAIGCTSIPKNSKQPIIMMKPPMFVVANMPKQNVPGSQIKGKIL
jgi:hypothetical protein